jgi:rare lipoprotein A
VATGEKLLLVAAMLFGFTACSTTRPREAGAYYLDDGPPQNVAADLESIPDAQPRREPLKTATTKAYTALGQRFVPMTRLEPYRAQGRASWYGKRYHGQATASGEIYDMLAMTAAHPTLPIPSYARVRNPSNGRSVVVRINDRGPFHAGRLIDLSYVAALKLDLVRTGGGEVDVELVIPDEDGATSARDDLQMQLGAFQSLENARAAQASMVQGAPWVADRLFLKRQDGMHKLMAGPFTSREEAMQVAERIETRFSIRPILSRYFSQYVEP